MTYNVKIARLKDIFFCPLSPNKRQSKKLLPFDKSRNGHDQETSYHTIEDIRVWSKSVRLSIQPYQKVGTNLSDAQKGEKGRILNCIGNFKTPRLP